MDLDAFLETGNVKPNPAYNSKTKKGKFQAPTLVDYNAGNSITDRLTSNISRVAAGNLYSLNSDDVEKFADYDVYLSPEYTQQELERERAENQSALEQTGRMIGQAVVNEVVLGSIKGFSDLFDATINGINTLYNKATGNEEEYNDFTNPLSKSLEEIQDNIKDVWAIYQKNPGETWDVTDFGWWANNGVSIASTASMLLPSIGITKSLSYIGRSIRAASAAGKGGKAVNTLNKIGDWFAADRMGAALSAKYGNKFKALSDAGATSDRLRTGREILQNAFMSRTMEGYMEAREVYRETIDDAKDRLSKLNTDERAEFFKNNPEFVGKDDDTIAHEIAGQSAEETFRNDYAMLLMDAIQFKALGNLYSGTRTASNAQIALTKKKAKEKLLGIAKPESNTWVNDQLFKLKYNVTHPLEGMFAVEWSEGFEEGYQGIQAEKGKEILEKHFNPKYTPREIESYLSDPAIWEQAFWGVMGSVGFKGVNWAGGKLHTKLIEPTLNKLLYDKDKINDIKLANEKRKNVGINTWADKTNEFIRQANIIREGKNPNKPVLNEKDEPLKDDNGNIVYETIDESSKDFYLDRHINDFVADLALDSSDRGLFDVLDSFLTDPDIARHIKQETKSEEAEDAYVNMLHQKLKRVSDEYTKEMYKLRTNIHVKNPYVGQIVARSIVKTKLNIEDLEGYRDNISNQIADLMPENADYTEWESKGISFIVDKKLKELNDEEVKVHQNYAKKEISEQAYNAYIKDIARKRASVINFANANLVGLNESENFKQLFSALQSSIGHEIDTSSISGLMNEIDAFASQFSSPVQTIPDKPVQDLMIQRAWYNYYIQETTDQIPQTTEDYQREYDEHSVLLDKITHDKFVAAVDKVLDYIQKQDNLEQAKNDIMSNNVEELQDALDILKIGHYSTQEFWGQLGLAFALEQKRREKTEHDKSRVTVDGEELPAEEAAAVRRELETPPPSTGEGTQSTQTERQPQSQQTPEAEPTPDVVQTAIDEEAKQEFEAGKIDDNIRSDVDKQMIAFDDIEFQRWHMYGSAVVRDMFKNDEKRFYKLNVNSVGTGEFDALVNDIVEAITLKIGNIDNDTLVSIAKMSLKSMLKIIDLRKHRNTLDQLIAAGVLKERYSATGVIEDIDTIEKEAALIKDIIDKYLDITNPNRKSTKPTVNLLKMYDTIMNGIGLDDDIALGFFSNLNNFLLNDKKRALLNYNFIKVKDAQKLFRNPQYIKLQLNALKEREQWESKYEHIGLSRRNKDNAREIVRQLKQGTVLTAMSDGYSVGIYHGNQEIGMLSGVKANKENNSFTIHTNNGIRLTVREQLNDAGLKVYRSDDILEEFARYVDAKSDGVNQNSNELYDAIYNHLIDAKGISSAHLLRLYNETIIGKIFNTTNENGDSLLVNKHYDTKKGEWVNDFATMSEVDKVGWFLDKIYNIYSFKAKFVQDPGDVINTWRTYTISSYKNYSFTHKLMNTPNAQIKFVNTWDGVVEYNIDGKQYDVNTRGFNAKDNPLVAVHNGKIIVDGQSDTRVNSAGFKDGTMGFIVRDSANGPALALVTSKKPVSSNAKFSKLVTEELNSLFSKYFDNVEKFEFKDLANALQMLIGGNIEKNRPFSLFHGLGCYKDKGNNYMGIGYETKKGSKEYKYIIKINKNKKDGTPSKTIYFSPTGESKDAVAINGPGKALDIAIKTILDKLQFNTSYFTFLNHQNGNFTNIQNTPYFHTNYEGKIVISIGSAVKNGDVDNRLIYDSFTDFVLKENTFMTNQELNKDGGYFSQEGSNSIYVDASGVTNPPPVKGGSKAISLDSLGEVHGRDIEIDTLMEAANVPSDVANFLKGENEYKISLIPNKVRFNEKLPQYTDGVTKIDKDTKEAIVHISKGFLNRATDLNYLTTKLIHEQLHAQFTKLDNATRRRIVQGLKDTYKATIDAIEKDINGDDVSRKKLAKNIKDWLDNISPNRKDGRKIAFTIEDYGNSLPSDDKKKYYNKSQEDREAQFFEEWLVESLSQSALRRYLNNTTYGDTNINVQEKTIFQKIIELLLRLFKAADAQRLKNSSILAKQFEILGNMSVEKTDTQQTDTTTNNADNTNTTNNDNTNKDDNVDNNVDNTKDKDLDDTTQTPESLPTDDTTQTPDADNSDDSFDIFDAEDEFGDGEDSNFTFDEETDENSDNSSDDNSPFSTTDVINDVELSPTDNNLTKYINNTGANPTGVNLIPNMNDYLSQFDESDRERIRASLEDGTIQYVCY